MHRVQLLGRRPLSLGMLGLLLLACLSSLCRADENYVLRESPSAPGEAGSMPNEAVDLSTAAEQLEGAESARSMEELFAWAIEHSDHEKLKDQADAVRREKAAQYGLEERKKRVRELIDIMNQQPTETQLLQEAIEMLSSASSSTEERIRALQALQILVEPIDNANNLKPMNGITPVVESLSSPSAEVRATAAYVLGTAASNNAVFQKALLEAHPHIFKNLVELCRDADQECAAKGLYAVAALVRNMQSLRAAFVAAGGLETLEELLQRPHASTEEAVGSALRVKRKALSLVMDLITLDESLGQRSIQTGLPKAILALLREPDNDLQEKALGAARTLLHMGPKARDEFLKLGADREVQALHVHLVEIEDLMRDSEDGSDHYHKYLTGLCAEVADLLSGKPPKTDHSEL